MLEGLIAFTEAMSREGPYFSGESLNAVDIALLPFAYRIDVLLAYYQNYSLPREGKEWQRYHRWFEAMLDSPAFRATATDRADYKNRLVEHYLPYSKGGGQTDLTQV